MIYHRNQHFHLDDQVRLCDIEDLVEEEREGEPAAEETEDCKLGAWRAWRVEAGVELAAQRRIRFVPFEKVCRVCHCPGCHVGEDRHKKEDGPEEEVVDCHP